MRFLLIFALMLAAEGLVVKDKGEGVKKQQKRGSAGIGSDSVSTSAGTILSSAEAYSSEGPGYSRYGLGSEGISLSSESTGQENSGITSGTIGQGSTGLRSGGFENDFRSGRIVLLTVNGVGHGSGLGGIGASAGGYSLGSRSLHGAGFSSDLRGGDIATGHDQVTTVKQQVPVSVPQAVPVPVPVHLPVPGPAHYLVEVPRPVHLSIPHQVRVVLNRPYPVTITRPVPVSVLQPDSVPVAPPDFITIPQHVRLQIPQPVAVPVPRPVTLSFPHPVVVPSISEISYSSDVAGLGPSAGSGGERGLGFPSRDNFAYKSSYGSSGLQSGQVLTPLKGVYVPSYLGGLHGLYGGPNSIHGSG